MKKNEQQRTLRQTLLELLAAHGIDCPACCAVAEDYIVFTDIYGTRGWRSAARAEGGRLVMEGIIHRPDADGAFSVLFGRNSFGYAANEDARCPRCARRWRYEADYHFGMFDGRLVLTP